MSSLPALQLPGIGPQAEILESHIALDTSCHHCVADCAGVDSYKWMLYGDDDTVFVLDNVIKVLSSLDYTQPYFLSDALWWPDNGNGAPACLCTAASQLITDAAQ